MNMDACLPGHVAAEATAATKVETQGRKGRGRRRREKGRERGDSKERGEQDEKCNYDFEKWARPPSRKNEHFRTGFSLERYLGFLD